MGKENTTDAKGEPAVASTALLAALRATGFEAREEGGTCEKCGNESTTLYFGNSDYWDCREGSYWCAGCVVAMHETNERDYASAMGGQANGKDQAL